MQRWQEHETKVSKDVVVVLWACVGKYMIEPQLAWGVVGQTIEQPMYVVWATFSARYVCIISSECVYVFLTNKLS